MSEPASHETISTGNANHVGDPEFQERQFVDSTGYAPPWWMRDAFTKPARTYADETIEEVQDPGYVAAISKGGQTPHESEFSWGLGNANSLTKGPGPNPLEEMKAVQRTNPADPAASHIDRYKDWAVEA